MMRRLHIVTDDGVLTRPDFVDVAKGFPAEAYLHLRGHQTSAARLVELAQALDKTRVIINDRVDVALAVDARGVHVGIRSLPLEIARNMVGGKKLVGFSAHTIDEARFACQHGADYAFLGPVFKTPSHPDAKPAGLGLVYPSPHQPVIAIGGITHQNVPKVLAEGAAGVAVISAVWGAKDPVQAAEEFVKILNDQNRSER